MTERYYHRKLVRDKIPEIIKATGDEFSARVMRKTEFEKELNKKLVEEAKELAEAPKSEILDELADVLELTKSIAAHNHIPFSRVEKVQEEKRKKRGGFKKKLFLIWSTRKRGK